jgi:hypothetical protein
MKHKETIEFTKEEKEWMDTLAINYIIAQADGFQSGYGQAISDFKEYIIDYWNGSDDKPQESILNVLVDLGGEHAKRKEIAAKNIETAKERDYEKYYIWHYRDKNEPFGCRSVALFTKKEPQEDKTE